MINKALTDKRLQILTEIKQELQDTVAGILVGGSMGFGQYYSIRETSDIDLVVVCTAEQLDSLLKKELFKESITPQIANLFKGKVINLFWNTKIISGVEVNSFVYEKEAYEAFCLLKKDLQIFIKNKPAETQTAYGFDGLPLVVKRNVQQFEDGYLFTKPALMDNHFWGGVPRQDFFYSGMIVFEETNFLSELEKKVWKAVIAQLVTQYGIAVDLNKYNVLNTHFTYQREPERLPESVINNIKNRTELELTILRTNNQQVL